MRRSLLLDNEVKRISFDSNGSHLAAACSCGDVLVYDTSQCPAIACVLPGPRECTFDVAWGVCPQTHARILVSASHDHTCGYWLHGCLAGAPSSVSSASSSHTSKAVAFTSDTILDSMPRRRARSPSLDPKSKKPRLAPTFGCDDFTIVWQFTTCNASHDSDLATWISFDTQDSCRVERAFQEWNTLKDNPQDGGGKIHVERCSRVYEIDFSRMLQTSMQTRTIRKLRRFPLSASSQSHDSASQQSEDSSKLRAKVVQLEDELQSWKQRDVQHNSRIAELLAQLAVEEEKVSGLKVNDTSAKYMAEIEIWRRLALLAYLI